MALLDVTDLEVAFATPEGDVKAVNSVSFSLDKGECLGVVGESGSGKTQTFLAVMGVVAGNARVSGSAVFDGRDLITLKPSETKGIRGSRIAFIMQDSLSALTPHMRIGEQLCEMLVTHQGMGDGEAEQIATETLGQVRIPEAKRRMRMYPHELSGGMRQRVTIAMGIICQPDILIADEPTTALDVTIQAEILDIFDELRRERGMAIVLITHDLGVVAGRTDRVMVMYGGRIAETAPTDAFFAGAKHPYSLGLLESTPRVDTAVDQPLITIPGRPPDLLNLPAGCTFAPRCTKVLGECAGTVPPIENVSGGHQVACLNWRQG